MTRRVRPICAADDAAIAAVIRCVMPEYGADGPGFALHDPEVGAMTAAYDRPGAAYLVLDVDGEVVGGAGVAPLDGGDGVTCELRKMYVLPQARGGAGRLLLAAALDTARHLGWRRVYLETLTGMDAAQRLYAAAGFRPLCAPLGATGHFGCDRWYLRDLATDKPAP